MSTISTQLNWGSSYLVYDFYQKQINPSASEKRLVSIGRLCTVGLMIFSAILALLLQSALQIFDILLTFGAGTGLIFILRWFWWRINAWSEISAMFASGILSILLKTTSIGDILFKQGAGLFPSWFEYPFVVLVTSAIWITVTYITPAEDKSVLRSFYKRIQPGGPGWKKVIDEAVADEVKITADSRVWGVPSGIWAMILGCGMIYCTMFSTGYWIYGQYIHASVMTVTAFLFGILLIRTWKKVRVKVI